VTHFWVASDTRYVTGRRPSDDNVGEIVLLMRRGESIAGVLDLWPSPDFGFQTIAAKPVRYKLG
jgi:hypothetical protein